MKTGAKALAMASILLAAASAFAAQDGGWNFEVTPYFWAAGVEGDVTASDGTEYDVDMEFDDLFDAVDAGAGVMALARLDSFVVGGQFDYVGMDSDQLDPAPAGGSIQTDSFLGELAAGWRFQPFERSTIDVLGGVRYAWIKNEIDITGVGSGEDSIDIVDGVVVVRPTFHLTKKWSVNTTFDIGAGDSDLTWQVQPNIQYQINDNLAVRAGYRRVHYDVEGDHGNEFDAAFQGFIVGVSVMF
ncbi:MAG: outer membrane protein [Solirubrobacterales bacterium]